MDSRQKGITTIDAYIATFPDDIQKTLQKLRLGNQGGRAGCHRKDQLSNAHLLFEWKPGPFCRF